VVFIYCYIGVYFRHSKYPFSNQSLQRIASQPLTFALCEVEMTMAKSMICAVGTRMVSVDDAIEMRDNAKRRKLDYPDFRCSECGESVSPHCAGGGACAHFEHLFRNPNCRLSDPAR